MYSVYLLQHRDGTIYTGSTKNLKQRLAEHVSGHVLSTQRKRPVRLMYYEGYISREDALAREAYLKTGDGRREIRKQLKRTLPGPIV